MTTYFSSVAFKFSEIQSHITMVWFWWKLTSWSWTLYRNVARKLKKVIKKHSRAYSTRYQGLFIYHKATRLKQARYWHKRKQTEGTQQGAGRDAGICEHLIYEEMVPQDSGERKIFSANGSRKIEYPGRKLIKWSPTSHCI